MCDYQSLQAVIFETLDDLFGSCKTGDTDLLNGDGRNDVAHLCCVFGAGAESKAEDDTGRGSVACAADIEGAGNVNGGGDVHAFCVEADAAFFAAGDENGALIDLVELLAALEDDGIVGLALKVGHRRQVYR